MKKANHNKVKKLDKINEKVLMVGVDIGKYSNSFCWRVFSKAERREKAFSHTISGYSFFWKRVMQLRALYKIDQIIIGIESTGSYGEPLLHYLKDKPIKLVQVNPMHSSRMRPMRGNSPTKSDGKDPFVIIDIIQLNNYLHVIIPRGVSADLRHLSHSRERAIVRRTSLFNQLESLVFKNFPEFLFIMKKLTRKSSLYLLKHYPSPEDIVNLGVTKLSQILWKVSRGQLDSDRALELFKAAQCSVGIKDGRKSILKEIAHLLEDLALNTTFIETLEEEMSSYLEKTPYSRYMLSIKGIGEVTVAGLIGEVGQFEDYENHYNLIKLAGLNLCERQSGRYKGQIKISKFGRSLMRKLLYFASLNVVKKDGILHEYYQSLLKRGMKSIPALTAVSRKLMRILFALVRDKKNYVSNYKLTLAA